MVISRPKMTFVGQFAPPCASTRRGLSDGVGEKIYPQNSIFLKNGISPRPLGEVGVKKCRTSIRVRVYQEEEKKEYKKKSISFKSYFKVFKKNKKCVHTGVAWCARAC